MKCPFCAEEIQNAALVCKHCGRSLKSKGSTGKAMIIGALIGYVVNIGGCIAIGYNVGDIKAMLFSMCVSVMGAILGSIIGFAVDKVKN